MDGSTVGLIGGLCGGFVGVGGGIAGTYHSLRSARTPALRRLMAHATGWLWLGSLAMLACRWWVPSPWCWLAWVAYAVFLPVGIVRLNQRYRELSGAEPGSGGCKVKG